MESSRLGLRVFPLADGTKKPRKGFAWRTRDLATTDLATIQSWGRFTGYGIATGPKSGVVVLDVDPRRGGTLASLGAVGTTAVVQSGGGGQHLYYAYPAGVDVPNLGHDELGPGIEVKADGCYVVGPGSLHPTGTLYRWVVPPWEDPLGVASPDGGPFAPLPDALLQRILACARRRETVADLLVSDTPHEEPPSADGYAGYFLLRALARVAAGTRNLEGYGFANQLRDHGVPREHAERALKRYWGSASKVGRRPYSLEEALASLRSAYAGQRRPPCLLVLPPPPPPPPRGGRDPQGGESSRVDRYHLSQRCGSLPPHLQPFPDYLAVARAADALPRAGDLRGHTSPASRRRRRQEAVFRRVWDLLWPTEVFDDKRLRLLVHAANAHGYAGHECQLLVWALVEIFIHPHRQADIRHAVAYTYTCLALALGAPQLQRRKARPRPAPTSAPTPAPPHRALRRPTPPPQRIPPQPAPPPARSIAPPKSRSQALVQIDRDQLPTRGAAYLADSGQDGGPVLGLC